MLTISGCSIALQSHLPAGRPASSSDIAACSSSKRLPRADAIFLGAELLTAVAGQALHAGLGPLDYHEDLGTVMTGTALAAAVLQLASMRNGYDRAEACAQAQSGAMTSVSLRSVR